jgi:hypothetical protein
MVKDLSGNSANRQDRVASRAKLARRIGHASALGFLGARRLPRRSQRVSTVHKPNAYFTTSVKKLFKVCVCPFKVVVNDKL